MDAARQFTVNARWAMLAKFISAGASAPLLLLLPRYLGKTAYGQFALAVSVLVVLRMFAGGGLGYATGRRLAEFGSKDSRARAMMAAGLSLQLALSLAVAVIFVAAAGPAGAMLGAGRGANGALPVLFVIAGLGVVFLALVEFFKAAFQGLQRFNFLALVTAIEFAGKLLLAGGLAVAGYGVVVIFGAYTAALALAAAAGMVLVARHGLSRPVSPGRDWRDLFSYNMPLMLTTAGIIIYTELDTMMLAYFSGFGQTGAYAAALSITRAAPLFAMPFGQAAAPLMLKLVNERQGKAVDFLNRLLRYVAAVFFPIAVAIVVTAPQLVRIWGPEFGDAVVPLRIMSLFMLSSTLGVVISPITDYLGAAGHRARWMMVSVAADVALDFLLIPWLGAAGAATATAITHGPFVLGNLHYLLKRIGLSERRLAADLGRVAGAAAAAGGGATLIMSWNDNLAVGLASGTAVYLAALFILGVFSRGELAEVTALLRTREARSAGGNDELVSDPVD